MKILFATDDVLEIPYDTLVGVNLSGLNFHRAILENMDFHGSSFANCDLRGAFVANSNLKNCDLSDTILVTAYFMHATLQGAKLHNCRAMFCNFTGGNLDEVDILNADFSNCNLCGAVMTCKNIRSAIFKDAVYDKLTVWPSNFDPIAAGCMENKS
jgi:uncharacterized protein YjbI with pentapeptide repeats